MAQAIKIKSDKTMDYTPEAAVSAGDVVLFGDAAAIATRDIAIGELGSLETCGTFDIVKATGALSAGDAVFWDVDGNPVSGTAGSGAAASSGDAQLGFAVAAALSGDETVRVLVTTGMVNTNTIGGAVTADSITGSDSSLGITGLAGSEGAGGAIVVAGGAGDGAAEDGGAVTIRGGAKAGSGADGAVSIGATNTSGVAIGASGVAAIVTGPLTRGVGASTAAAGSTTSDAGVLPAATHGVYPTTAADGTKGVRIHADDKVTGRMLFIGNGVSNQVLKVYAPAGGAINGAAADAAFSSASGKGVLIVCLSSAGNTWLAL